MGPALFPASQKKGAASTAGFAKQVELAQRLLEISKNGPPAKRELNRLRNTSPRSFYVVVSRLPAGSPLRRTVDDAPLKPAPITKRPRLSGVELPHELAEGVALYEKRSHQISRTKHQRGHRYTNTTVLRRVREATRFTIAMAQQGLSRWAEVSQHILDEYVGSVGRDAGGHAYTFLVFIHREYRLTQRIVRPRKKLQPPSEAVATREQMLEILKEVNEEPDLEVRAAAFLLALFAQPISRTKELRLSNFRLRKDRVEALFAEEWLPLDRMTSKLIRRIAPELERAGPVSLDLDRELLSLSYDRLSVRVRKLIGFNLKKVRLGAIANIIHSGVTDRGAISRTFGIAINHVGYVEKTFQWDLQSTVPPEVVAARNRVFRGEHASD